MSAVLEPRWGGELVDVVQNGVLITVRYRHAVSLISRGMATWAPAPQKAPDRPQETRRRAPKAKSVSAPTKSAEGVQTGYEPSPTDP